VTPEIIENLIKVSESLDKKGLTEQSSVIDSFSGKLINLMKKSLEQLIYALAVIVVMVLVWVAFYLAEQVAQLAN
jgi:hypothetical protein